MIDIEAAISRFHNYKQNPRYLGPEFMGWYKEIGGLITFKDPSKWSALDAKVGHIKGKIRGTDKETLTVLLAENREVLTLRTRLVQGLRGTKYSITDEYMAKMLSEIRSEFGVPITGHKNGERSDALGVEENKVRGVRLPLLEYIRRKTLENQPVSLAEVSAWLDGHFRSGRAAAVQIHYLKDELVGCGQQDLLVTETGSPVRYRLAQQQLHGNIYQC